MVTFLYLLLIIVHAMFYYLDREYTAQTRFEAAQGFKN